MRTLETVYAVHRRSWTPEHNRPVVYWEVLAGHNQRDYAAEGYTSAQTLIGKYRSEAEALTAVDKLTSWGSVEA